ncbi:MAG: hypothetical protein LC649_00735 [Bacteroidales bacterium]|nr:hypothetical protein [Bacteroidales bacterium]
MAVLSSCSSDSCEEPVDAFINLSLRSDTDPDAEAIDSVTVYGAGMEEFLLYDTLSLSNIELPLFPGSESVSYIIRHGSFTDTVLISYTSELQFISKACGYSFFYTIREVNYTTNSINRILVINDYITPGYEENLRAFF